MSEENYAEESAHIASLIKDFAAAELKATIAKLNGMSACVPKLTLSEALFLSSYVAYEMAKAKESDSKNATTLKKKLLVVLNGDLVVYRVAMCSRAFRNH